MGLLGLGRYGGVLVGLALGAGVGGSLCLGAVVSFLVLPVLSRLGRASGSIPAPPDTAGAGAPRPLSRSVIVAGGASLAMLAASYADLILARGLLSSADSGAYAVGAVLTKGALWMPGVVTVMALPRLAKGSPRTLAIALGIVGGCGALLVLGTVVAGRWAVTLVGGEAFAFLAPVTPLFAATGALYALAFVFVNARIAAGQPWPAVTLWSAVAGLATVVLLVPRPTIGSIAATAAVTAAVATAVLARPVLSGLIRRGRTTAGVAVPLEEGGLVVP
jgi:O-antigen/teichoic acid export membrane protein